MTATPLVKQVASEIVRFVQNLPDPDNIRLAERKLAEELRVSRSPVRSALKLLEDKGFVCIGPRGGYVPNMKNGELPSITFEPVSTVEEETYQQMADDRLAVKLVGRVTENKLIRRYHISRAQLTRVLKRIESEGWVEQLPGHGWDFIEIVTTMKTYQDSFRFRKIIEPYAILDQNFTINEPELLKRKAEQERLLAGKIWELSNKEIFHLNRKLHDTVMDCSNNSFFITSLQRANGLRRLMEYKHLLDKKITLLSVKEHIEIIDLLLNNKREQAATVMSRHLGTLSEIKTEKSDPDVK